MVQSGEKADCADVAFTALVRCAAKFGLRLRFRYYDGGWKYYDSDSNKFKTKEEFEKFIRNQLGAINIFDNTKQKDYKDIEVGDMFVYDLRFHEEPSRYTGHTMPVLAKKRSKW